MDSGGVDSGGVDSFGVDSGVSGGEILVVPVCVLCLDPDKPSMKFFS